ncbi:MAG: 1,4-alpha-glucan branching enzyme, partial [Arthrobacter sp.]|nr:1,4-alpha-glucan branching enzyme [Arthrobacter sp.]
MTRPTLPPALSGLLGGWLPGQRWFPVKTAEFSFEPVGVLRLAPGRADAEFEVWLLAVTYPTADGNRTDVVQVPLSFRHSPLPGAESALLGETDKAGRAAPGDASATPTPAEAGAPNPVQRWIYDGVHDPGFVAAWLELMRNGDTSPVGNAGGHLVASGYRLPFATGTVKVLSGEQSNSSVIVHDGESAAILKFFRVLSEGQNPEVEIGAALTAGRTAEVPATLGWVTGEWETPTGDPQGGTRPAQGELAVAHEFLAGGLDAWRLAVQAASQGRDFTAEAHALGAATATVHRRLAEFLGVATEAVPGGIIAPGVAQRVRQSWAQAGRIVGGYDEALEELLRRLRGYSAGPLQRIHGDLHLGQILQVPGGAGAAPRWAILDFEGEPLRPISERNFPDVPLRDVVGMLRSFDYAAGAAVRESAEADVPANWVDDCAEAFLAGYAEVIPGSIDRDAPLFVALWLDKALYEVIYEVRNRPDWLSIPVNASRRLLGSTGSGDPAEAEAEGITMTGSARIDRPGAPLPVDADTLARVAAGEHHAPHSVLGAHFDDHGHVTIRSVKHMAEAVSVVTAAGTVPMHHEAGGVWVAVLDPLEPGHVPDYRLEVTYEGEGPLTVDDPYRYLPTVGEVDLHLIGEGRHERLWDVLGAHVQHYKSSVGDIDGVSFAVWAPNAQAVRVKGDFNGWDGREHSMRSLGSSGVWELFIPGVLAGACYKFEIRTRHGYWVEKADPLAFGTEVPPLTASRVVEPSYVFKDAEWMEARAARDPHNSPMSVYEVHLGSWRQGLNYREMAQQLVDYLDETGFTHVELLPVAEHPF